MEHEAFATLNHPTHPNLGRALWTQMVYMIHDMLSCVAICQTMSSQTTNSTDILPTFLILSHAQRFALLLYTDGNLTQYYGRHLYCPQRQIPLTLFRPLIQAVRPNPELTNITGTRFGAIQQRVSSVERNDPTQATVTTQGVASNHISIKSNTILLCISEFLRVDGSDCLSRSNFHSQV